MNTIVRELRIIKSYIRLSYKNYIQFPLDFLMNFVMVLFDVIGVVLFWWSLAELNISLVGWTNEELLVFVGFSVFSEAVSKILFGFRDLEYFILDGSFDKFLIRPINPVKTMLLEKLNIFAIVCKTILAIGIFLVVGFFTSLKLQNEWMAVLTLIAGTLAYELLYGTFSLLAFWFGKIFYARNLVFSFRSIRKYPLDIFSAPIKNIFTFIIPLAFIATIPTNIILGRLQYPTIYFILSVVLLLIAYALFNYVLKRALAKYESTGS